MARDVKRRHCPEHLWASITPWRDTWCLRCRRYRLPWWRRRLRQWQEREGGQVTEPDPAEDGLSAKEIRDHVDEYRAEHGLPPQKT